MSNPAIVLLTDPSRCGMGDVHHLVQALREIQQMGEYAAPQAFCDHPAAAKEFMAAYTHAYPKLVLESREIPTPDHLEALITTGQIGPLARPHEVRAVDQTWRPPEHNGLNAFPLVVLTLGSPQVLLDALRQNHLMKDNISLIDIVSDGTGETGPVSIAEAVAIRGRVGEGLGEDAAPGGAPPALDEVAGASATGTTDFVVREDQIGLATVEPADPPSHEAQAYEVNGHRLPGEVEPTPAAPPQPIVEAGQTAPAAASQDSSGTMAGAEPAVEPSAAAQPGWPADGNLIAPLEPTAPAEPVDLLPELVVVDDGVPDDVPDEEIPENGAEAQPEDEEPDEQEPEQPSQPGDAAGGDQGQDQPSASAAADDADVHYQPVGSLSAEVDVLYPEVGGHEAFATLRELALTMSDDGMLDTDATAEIAWEPEDDQDPDPASLEAILSQTSHDDGVVGEDFHSSTDIDPEDAGDTAVHHPPHDSDL